MQQHAASARRADGPLLRAQLFAPPAFGQCRSRLLTCRRIALSWRSVFTLIVHQHPKPGRALRSPVLHLNPADHGPVGEHDVIILAPLRAPWSALEDELRVATNPLRALITFHRSTLLAQKPAWLVPHRCRINLLASPIPFHDLRQIEQTECMARLLV